MDDFLDLPTLIVIVIAVFVLFRLRSVLGTRTGTERPPVERQRAAEAAKEDGVVPGRPRPVVPDLDDERRQRKLDAEIEQYARGNAALAEGLRSVAQADTSFTPKSFIEGAKQAYEMIVTAYAAGDRQTLKNLLEKEVHDGFVRAIGERETLGQKVDFTFVGLPRVEISEAEYDKRNVLVTVRFRAEVVSATRDKNGDLVEGNADQVQVVADEWTFQRNPKRSSRCAARRSCNSTIWPCPCPQPSRRPWAKHRPGWGRPASHSFRPTRPRFLPPGLPSEAWIPRFARNWVAGASALTARWTSMA